ncbi:hypothetical protein JNB_03030 [Janibacter sp. HTCC2649]|uniref:DNA glycosylase AlkZ-like family protein n=1 Tax=Janibacter sp. HTCC2649 TaxID=313589 RepID=UPI000066ED32|nr:crosslink repair DNA glycosylase YcaQ family protein [Janibacter sp. HTCC2649]EAP99108.1 hypothetical protein JNB_03030 [Janibacter sp. HTCC2649]
MKTTAHVSVTRAQALSWRTERQFLGPLVSRSAAEVVGRLGAVLSMDESLAELAVHARSSSVQSGDLTRALAAGEVIKAFAFRGAVHYLSPEEGGVYLSLRQAGRQWELPSWVEHYQLTPSDWPDFRAAVREALADGPLTVAELGEAVAKHRAYQHLRPVFDDGAGTLIKPLSWQGDLTLGPRREGRLTLQLLESNPRWGGIPELDVAGPRAIKAYFSVYGPASLDNLDHWLGKGLSAGRKRLGGWLDDLGDELVPVDLEGGLAYVARQDVDALEAATPSDVVRLLPGHDQWIMGPGTSDGHVTPPAHRDLMTRKANPVIDGGVVCGTWARARDAVTVTWLGPGRRPEAALASEVDRLAELLGRDLTLQG